MSARPFPSADRPLGPPASPRSRSRGWRPARNPRPGPQGLPAQREAAPRRAPPLGAPPQPPLPAWPGRPVLPSLGPRAARHAAHLRRHRLGATAAAAVPVAELQPRRSPRLASRQLLRCPLSPGAPRPLPGVPWLEPALMGEGHEDRAAFAPHVTVVSPRPQRSPAYRILH